MTFTSFEQSCQAYTCSAEYSGRLRKDIAGIFSRIRIIRPITKPDEIRFPTGLPETWSGKIMHTLTRIVERDILLDPGYLRKAKSKDFVQFINLIIHQL
ncbi:hypothetical protein [Mucilaginibacter dorajii]|uniref:hypothetical protein n=1 Tax=Mucilaginibacter dorajii TaxID=692994 RepID=UPI00216728CC|nr:hypothetical protein [Mucilaginibacter dorajii]MCS3732440.1 acyl-coenzyme A synthetase/AMP-(fatty) acid ligase [Mucilaginibacter dorajii]